MTRLCSFLSCNMALALHQLFYERLWPWAAVTTCRKIESVSWRRWLKLNLCEAVLVYTHKQCNSPEGSAGKLSLEGGKSLSGEVETRMEKAQYKLYCCVYVDISVFTRGLPSDPPFVSSLWAAELRQKSAAGTQVGRAGWWGQGCAGCRPLAWPAALHRREPGWQSMAKPLAHTGP